MCEFCHQHGEGRTWYLRAENYSEDLLADLRRRDYIRRFFRLPERYPAQEKQLARLDKLPGFVKRAVRGRVSERMKRTHFGQVIPFEDIERIFEFVISAVRLPCVCRHITVGKEQRFCYGLSGAPDGGELMRIVREIDQAYLTGPDTSGLEPLSRTQALAAIHDHEKQGLCHTVWTFVTPFIGGICNCDRTDCLGLRTQLRDRIQTLFRAETVAVADPDRCNGCRECLRICPFGAMAYSAARRRVAVDPKGCFGCGICRSVCPRNALSLRARSDTPSASEIWS